MSINKDRLKSLMDKYSDVQVNNKVIDDTNLANALIIAKGKELRKMCKHKRINERFEFITDIIKRDVPSMDVNGVKFTLFREGIIHTSILNLINFFMNVTILVIVIYFTLISDINSVGKFFMILICICISSLLMLITDLLYATRFSSYIGLGHNRK